jgi:hypothetical protein
MDKNIDDDCCDDNWNSESYWKEKSETSKTYTRQNSLAASMLCAHEIDGNPIEAYYDFHYDQWVVRFINKPEINTRIDSVELEAIPKLTEIWEQYKANGEI